MLNIMYFNLVLKTCFILIVFVFSLLNGCRVVFQRRSMVVNKNINFNIFIYINAMVYAE